MDVNLDEIDELLREEQEQIMKAEAKERELPASTVRIVAKRSKDSLPTERIASLEKELEAAKAELTLRAQITADDVASLDLELERGYSKELEAKVQVCCTWVQPFLVMKCTCVLTELFSLLVDADS